MKLLLSSLFIFSVLFSGGCVLGPTSTTSDGRTCRALSEKQLSYLTALTRNALKNDKKNNISPQEWRIINTTDPDLNIEYRGDCFGTVIITWETPTRKLGMMFDRQLDVRIPQCAMIVQNTDGKNFGRIRPNRTLRGR